MSNNVFSLYVGDNLESVGEVIVSSELFRLQAGLEANSSIRVALTSFHGNRLLLAPSLPYELTLRCNDECWKIYAHVQSWNPNNEGYTLIVRKAMQFINGRECLDWNPLNWIYKVNGEDRLAGIRSALT